MLKTDDAKYLIKRPIALLRIAPDKWRAIADTRRHGARFSLHFSHEMARAGSRDGLILIAITGECPELRLGLITSIAATSTFDSRTTFDLVSPIAPDSLASLLDSVSTPSLRTARNKLSAGTMQFTRISPKLGEALLSNVAAEPDNIPALRRIISNLRRPSSYNNARALQQDAVSLAIKAFGGAKEASSIALSGEDTAIATVRILEDAAIEHDARWMPGWELTDSDLTGRATFTSRVERLDVLTANKRPLEKLFGVDLIYFNVSHNALVMIQYKILEPENCKPFFSGNDFLVSGNRPDQEWVVRINDQFKSEISRMRLFDRDLSPSGPYRLNSSAFFFKLVRRNASLKSAGILLSLGHLDQLMSSGELKGPSGGLRISYQSLKGHYLRGDGFVELVRSGYVGTRGATTVHMQSLIKASLEGGNAVVAAIQSALKPD